MVQLVVQLFFMRDSSYEDGKFSSDFDYIDIGVVTAQVKVDAIRRIEFRRI